MQHKIIPLAILLASSLVQSSLNALGRATLRDYRNYSQTAARILREQYDLHDGGSIWCEKSGKRRKITRENIVELTPPTPLEAVSLVHAYLVANPEVAATLISGMGNIPHNLSKSNHIARIENMLFKSSGIANRAATINAFLGNPYGTPLSLQQYYAAVKACGGTVHIFTRPATALRGEEVIKAENIRRIKVPKTSLVHIPGQPLTAQDGNYIALEEYIEGLRPLAGDPLVHNPEIIRELVLVTNYCGLWWLYHKDERSGKENCNCFITPEGDVLCVDLEYPNNESPTTFYLNGDDKKERHRHLASDGFTHIEKMIRSYNPSNNPESLEKALQALRDAIAEVEYKRLLQAGLGEK